MEPTTTDALTEACRVAGIVAGEEAEITEIEKQIADKFREICKKIFSGTRYRMPKQRLCQNSEYGEVLVWGQMGAILQDLVVFDGDFHGAAQTLRVTTEGEIVAAWQHIYSTRGYDLFEGDWDAPAPYDVGHPCRPATDREIASCATTLAQGLLDALRKRIDSAKGEKAELQRIAGLAE